MAQQLNSQANLVPRTFTLARHGKDPGNEVVLKHAREFYVKPRKNALKHVLLCFYKYTETSVLIEIWITLSSIFPPGISLCSS